MTQQKEQISPSQLVSNGLLRAASDLGLTGSMLARITGLSEATISRLKNGTWTLQEGSKPYEISMVVLHVHQRLKSMMDGNRDRMKSWMLARNEDLGGAPLSLLGRIQGLFRVLSYLERRKPVNTILE